MRTPMLCPSSLVAAGLCVLALAQFEARTEVSRSAPPAPALEVCASPERAVDQRLVGLWQRYEALHEGDPLRFYYFHPEGFGIYRYGKVGLTNTHSFDYDASQGLVDLRFRKTDRTHTVRYRVEEVDGREWLVLAGDPREDLPEVRYFRAPDASAACMDGPDGLLPGHVLKDRQEITTEVAAGSLGGRLWGEEERYATGGMGFAIYQLQPQAIDGRGVGWFHRGDYDEWVTESLTYRQQGERLALGFTLRHDAQTTAIDLRPGPDGVRRLGLEVDPRDFWRGHTYRDMGPSFACAPGLK
jgi:hypothetical protein